MKLRKLAKDPDSGEGGCPTAYLAESGEFVIQGPQVDTDTMGNLENLLSGETAVQISPGVIARAYERFRQDGLL